jgi:putative ABC transport system ATP-binding protein
VIGSNGSGKSTLLNAIAGEIPVERGAILIDNVDVTRCPPHRRARLVARVFQDPMAGTCDSLTVEQNMALALRRTRSR